MNWEVQQPILEKQLNMIHFLAMGVIDLNGNTIYTDGTTASLGEGE